MFRAESAAKKAELKSAIGKARAVALRITITAAPNADKTGG
jgi:hypothetical protein